MLVYMPVSDAHDKGVSLPSCTFGSSNCLVGCMREEQQLTAGLLKREGGGRGGRGGGGGGGGRGGGAAAAALRSLYNSSMPLSLLTDKNTTDCTHTDHTQSVVLHCVPTIQRPTP